MPTCHFRLLYEEIGRREARRQLLAINAAGAANMKEGDYRRMIRDLQQRAAGGTAGPERADGWDGLRSLRARVKAMRR